MDLKNMTTAQLLELYNKTTGEKVKRFASHAAAIKRTAAAIVKHPKARTVTPNGGSKGKVGRPRHSKIVRATPEGEGQSRLQKGSFRTEVLAAVRNAGGAGAEISTLIGQFGPRVLGAISKLTEMGWLKREA